MDLVIAAMMNSSVTENDGNSASTAGKDGGVSKRERGDSLSANFGSSLSTGGGGGVPLMSLISNGTGKGIVKVRRVVLN